MSARDETGIYFPVNRATDVGIPPVPAARVSAAAVAVADYGLRKGLSVEDMIELLAMLRINRDTIENGLYATDAGQEGAA